MTPPKQLKRLPTFYLLDEPCAWVQGDIEMSDSQGRVLYFYRKDARRIIKRLEALLRRTK